MKIPELPDGATLVETIEIPMTIKCPHCCEQIDLSSIQEFAEPFANKLQEIWASFERKGFKQ